MGNIRLYGSTSGYTELAPPAVAPDGVLSLPIGVGTLLTAEGGKVLQIVRATDTTNRSTTSLSYVDANISVTITPQRSDSIILLLFSATWQVQFTGSPGASYTQIQITDSSNTALSGAEGRYIGDNSGSNTNRAPAGSITLIGYSAPNTTSAKTYKARFRSSDSTLVTLQLLNASNTAQMYAIEVSA